ncbi:hypothetical protein [Rhizobium rhizogenes]|uniref:hypothetical protein n=1 Tax=Rhizobium rhizogenes TaxID=359 RepID=UPI001F23C578|nr:hypothetical protein [Rhizobium rhizogenes]
MILDVGQAAYSHSTDEGSIAQNEWYAAATRSESCIVQSVAAVGCLSAYDDYPASELSEHIVLFTEVGIENLQQIIRNLRAVANPPSKPVAQRNRKKPRILRP